MITALGRDHNGTWLHDQTAGAGVDLADSVWSDSAPTATYLSILDGSGEMAVDSRERRDLGVMQFPSRFGIALPVALQHLKAEGVLALEVIVERALGHARMIHDILDSAAMKPPFVKNGEAGGKD